MLRTVEVGLNGRGTERFSKGRAEQCLAQLEVRAQLGRLIPARRCAVADATRQVRSCLLVVRKPQGGGAAEMDIELQAWIPQRFGERGELCQPFEAVGRVARNGVRIVAQAQQVAPILG